METRTRAFAAVGFTVVLFVLVQLGALALVQPFDQAGYQQVENPDNPTNSLVYVGAVLVLTAVMLAIIKLDVEWLLRWAIILTSGLLSWYVFSVIVPPWVVVSVAGTPVNILAIAAAGVVALALLVHPEWYVIDGAGVIIGAGAAGLFGISFGLFPAILLLGVLAVYDAISVYGTEHMLTLASGVMDLRLPVVLVVPLTLSYSFLEEEGPDTIADHDGDGGGGPDGEAGTGPDADADEADGAEAPDPFERDAFFIGLGDAVIPTILVASAAFFRPGDAPLLDVPGVALTAPALGAMVGTLVGLLVLMWMVMKGRPHAGLPLLNGGAIGGYLLGAVVAGVALVEALGVAPYL